MIDRQKQQLLRDYLAEGKSKSEAARLLGISRDTVHRWIRQGQLGGTADPVPPGPGRKLQPFKTMMREQLRCEPDIPAVRLFEQIQSAGYAGGYTQVKEFVREARGPRTLTGQTDAPADPRYAAHDFNRFRFS